LAWRRAAAWVFRAFTARERAAAARMARRSKTGGMVVKGTLVSPTIGGSVGIVRA